jgi:hypothetical protein
MKFVGRLMASCQRGRLKQISKERFEAKSSEETRRIRQKEQTQGAARAVPSEGKELIRVLTG